MLSADERLRRTMLSERMDVSTASGGYKGGFRDRRATRAWRPKVESADAALLPDLPDLRQRSADLERNMPLAGGAIATNVTSVVGDGLVFKSTIDAEILGLSPEEARLKQSELEREVALAFETADWTRKQNFYELQALAYHSVKSRGDTLMVRRWRKDPGDTYGTKVLLIEADRVSNPDRISDGKNPKAENGNSIIAGVEHNADGVAVAFHVSDKHPGDLRPDALTWERIPAWAPNGSKLCDLLMQRRRPEQTRGIPYLAPVIEALKQLVDYSDAEITAAVNSAMMFAFEEVPGAVDEEGNPVSALPTEGAVDLGDDEVTLENGAIIDTRPGGKIEIKTPGRPNSEFDNFWTSFVRLIGVALELPYEVVIKAFTASYSASRAALEIAYQFWRREQTFAADRFCQPYVEWVVEEAVSIGRLDLPGFFDDPVVRQAWLKSMWIPPAKISLDEEKDAKADKLNIETGIKSIDGCIVARGVAMGFDQVHAQRAREQKARKDADLLPKPSSFGGGGFSSGDDEGDDEA